MRPSRRFAAKAGQKLFQPGQDCPGFLILQQGTIRVTLSGSSGREVVLYRVRPGEVCLQSFTCLTSGQSYSAEGVVESDLLGELVPADQFHQRLRDDAAFQRDVMWSVARRFGEYQQLIEDVALTGFDARLAKVLLRLADANGLVQATHAALATETASGRAYVSRRLAEFSRQGLVEQRAEGIRLKDAPALQHLSLQTG